MGKIIKHCKKCENNPSEYRKYFDEYFTKHGFPKGFVDLGVVGYYTPNEDKNKNFCQIHPNEELENSPLTIDEYDIISAISTDLTFIHAMEELKQSDPIEFQLKLSQFKAQLAQQEGAKAQSDTCVKCAYCKSTNVKKISGLSKAGSVAMWGIFSKKVHKEWHCNQCGSDF